MNLTIPGNHLFSHASGQIFPPFLIFVRISLSVTNEKRFKKREYPLRSMLFLKEVGGGGGRFDIFL